MTEPAISDNKRPPLVKSGRKRNNDELMRNRTLSISFDPINLSQQVRRHHEACHNDRLPSSNSAVNDSKRIKSELKITEKVGDYKQVY